MPPRHVAGVPRLLRAAGRVPVAWAVRAAPGGAADGRHLCSPAATQQRRRRRAAGRLRDPRAAAHAAQPGHPVRLAGPLRGGRAPLQAGAGGPGEDVRPRPPGCGHHAEHPGLGVQASTFHFILSISPVMAFRMNLPLKHVFRNLFKLLF